LFTDAADEPPPDIRNFFTVSPMDIGGWRRKVRDLQGGTVEWDK